VAASDGRRLVATQIRVAGLRGRGDASGPGIGL